MEMPDKSKKIKLAIIGCGMVTETFHLPAAVVSDDFDITCLVDKQVDLARSLAQEYHIPIAESDYSKVIGEVDAAIVAVPHHLHSEISLDLLRNGIHVLVEKPMALKSRDCDRMIEAADQAGVVLSTGLLRRYYEASGYIKKLLEHKMLGNILSFDVREGMIFSWKSASDFMFRKFGGGGVMVDTGIHVLDTILWWMGDYEELSYFDDAAGGVEANAVLHMTMQNGAKGTMELSRTRNLRNTFRMQGERGSLEVSAGVNPKIRLKLENNESWLDGQVEKKKPDRNNKDVFIRQLADFAQAIQQNRPPYITGREGKRAVEAMEACYALKQPLAEPWSTTLKENL